MACFDVFVFPTRWDMKGFSLVLLEVMMMGCPIVTSNFSGIPEVVESAAILTDPELAKLADNLRNKDYQRLKVANMKASATLIMNHFRNLV